MIIRDIEKHYGDKQQIYLQKLYKAMLMASYCGLLRAGEVAQGPHVLKAKDVFIGKNKKKFLFILWTSKTHDRGSKPQMIKISATKNADMHEPMSNNPCPFEILNNFIDIRPERDPQNQNEQFFCFADKSPVTPDHFRKVLKESIKRCKLNPDLYNLHSLRIGRCRDLYDLGLSVETIKKIGRWKSNAVFLYLRS